MKKSFWDRNAKRYDRFMRKDAAAYEAMYERICPAVRGRLRRRGACSRTMVR